MRTISFTVYGEARPAGSKTAAVTKSGRVFVRDAAKGSQAWKRQVAAVAADAMGGAPLMDGPLAAIFMFVQPRPKSHFGKRGLLPSAPVAPIVRPDLLKLARAVEDALTGIVYRDDSQIVMEGLEKRYGEPARVEVALYSGWDTAPSDGLRNGREVMQDARDVDVAGHAGARTD